jgi:hypothetical protein
MKCDIAVEITAILKTDELDGVFTGVCVDPISIHELNCRLTIWREDSLVVGMHRNANHGSFCKYDSAVY